MGMFAVRVQKNESERQDSQKQEGDEELGRGPDNKNSQK